MQVRVLPRVHDIINSTVLNFDDVQLYYIQFATIYPLQGKYAIHGIFSASIRMSTKYGLPEV